MSPAPRRAQGRRLARGRLASTRRRERRSTCHPADCSDPLSCTIGSRRMRWNDGVGPQNSVDYQWFMPPDPANVYWLALEKRILGVGVGIGIGIERTRRDDEMGRTSAHHNADAPGRPSLPTLSANGSIPIPIATPTPIRSWRHLENKAVWASLSGRRYGPISDHENRSILRNHHKTAS